MAGDPSVWKEVAARLSLIDAAQRLGITLKQGVQSSPFREDKKLSFSVFRSKDGTLAFKDHADDAVKGGLFQFVKLATGWENKAVAKWLFEQSGVDSKPTEFSKGKAAESRRKAREALLMQHRVSLHEVPVMERPERWSDAVAGRWAQGAGWLDKNAGRVAESRGWPEWVVQELLGMDLMSGPALPWAEQRSEAGGQRSGGRGARHGVAFKMEMPVRSGAGCLELVPVGYHQRFVTVHNGERGKSWVFVPYVPRAAGRRSDFQQVLADEGRTVPPLPFVLGCLDNPKLIVILEGQWDAISFFETCGWFSDSVFPKAAVFGLRGVNGVDAFLAFYADWLRSVKPVVWLIGDNDRAGRKWAERQHTDRINETPSFIDRLQALGASRVVYRIIAEKFGKDFNDFYNAASPDAAFMQRWMDKLGLEV
jgi:hypothetical protein